MSAGSIMIQGTGSDVGKSVIVSGICRLLANDGYRVAPFKSQNMALNSFITEKGGEMGRAQVVQAQAAGVKPVVDMNPILLKPNRDNNSQVIVRGRPEANMEAAEYYSNRSYFLQIISESYHHLQEEYEVLVIEGAGSPGEINLRDKDMVNMQIASMFDVPVVLAADIDRGGVFASLVGTMEILNNRERNHIKALLINKYRGREDGFREGSELLEEYTSRPVLGVVPYIENLNIPEEDSLSASLFGSDDGEIVIKVIYLPHISNFTDFTALGQEPKTTLEYVKNVEELAGADAVIIPGSKNTIEDLEYLYQHRFGDGIWKLHQQNVPIIGICGGYQMLGKRIEDPGGIESDRGQIEGLGLLDIETVLSYPKTTRQVEAELISKHRYFEDLQTKELTGYEIHQGRTKRGTEAGCLLAIKENEENIHYDGTISKSGAVWGTYLHGIFANDCFRRFFINKLRIAKGLEPIAENNFSAAREQEKAFDRLARIIADNIDRDLLYKLIFA